MDLEKFLVEEFKKFHEKPELSFEEFETTARLKKILSDFQIKILDLPLETGFIAKIGEGEEKIALRTDIDALPIIEQTNLPYASKIFGKMHACGHDFHMTAVLGAAILLKKIEKNLRGSCLIIFQPGEEVPGGALKILETGALKKIKKIFGLHTMPFFEVGKIGISSGAIMASVDKIEINFFGKSSHASRPETGTDPILIAANFITAAQSIVSRNLSATNANVFSITHVEGGNTWNVIPEKIFLEGTIRSFSEDDRKKIKIRMKNLAEKIAESYGGSAEIKIIGDAPVLVNDKNLTEFAKKIAAEDFEVVDAKISMSGEDFACYLEKIPGVFMQIGTGISETNHNPKFQVNPAAIFPTAKFLAKLVENAF